MGDGDNKENGDLRRRKREWEGEIDKFMKSRQKLTKVGSEYLQGAILVREVQSQMEHR